MVHSLAYLTVTSPAAHEWRSFATDILGASVGPTEPIESIESGPEPVRIRLDRRPFRVEITAGDVDDLTALGWDVGADELESRISTLESLGIDVTLDEELAAARQATRAAWFLDPFGLRHELVVDVRETDDFEPAPHLQSGFVTGEQGMGHIVMMLPDLDRADRFLTQGLGLRLSDTVEVGREIRFYHCPGSAARHHSLAVSEVPGMIGVHHIMIEVADHDDVGLALDRVRRADIPLAMDHGRHPNDGMTSFYVRTPSGFELEYGSGGVLVDDGVWSVGSYDVTSIWGHHPPAGGPLRPGMLRRLEASDT